MILAGDVGGTKTNLALYVREGGGLRRATGRTFASGDYPSLEAIIAEFLDAHPRGKPGIERACVGVAGPVVGRRSRLTNLPWVIEEEALRRATGAVMAWLLNDLQATAYAVPRLPPGSVERLQQGEPESSGAVAVIAAGTGLGESFLMPAEGGWIPVATEGGHADFAPRGELEIRLLRSLSARFGRVSVERVLSGPGLENIYRFLQESERMAASPGVEARLDSGDAPQAVAEEGLNGSSETCRRALELFVSIYGAEAGNLALKVMATGGVFMGGGIAPKILPALKAGVFLESFRDKGRFRDLLARVPVGVILDPEAALLGAAWYAAEGGGLA